MSVCARPPKGTGHHRVSGVYLMQRKRYIRLTETHYSPMYKWKDAAAAAAPGFFAAATSAEETSHLRSKSRTLWSSWMRGLWEVDWEEQLLVFLLKIVSQWNLCLECGFRTYCSLMPIVVNIIKIKVKNLVDLWRLTFTFWYISLTIKAIDQVLSNLLTQKPLQCRYFLRFYWCLQMVKAK